MHYETFTTNDLATLAYQTSVPVQSVEQGAEETTSKLSIPETCILLLHGFSGSSSYFDRNVDELSQNCWVLAPDMRGHGRSQHTRHGYHVSRLAMDLHELVKGVIQARHPQCQIYAVGCSIGAAVLWTFTELFTDHDFAGLVFVDQAPLQDRSIFGWGKGLAHYGCYDEATTLEAQRSWASEDAKIQDGTHRGLVASCLGYRYAPSPEDHMSEEQQNADEEFFVRVSRMCDGKWLARLLADHTRYDHREAIEMITKPILVMAAKRSGCFSVEGMMETVRRAQMNQTRSSQAEGTTFDSGHWLFWEEPERFNQELIGFVKRCKDRIPVSNRKDNGLF